MEEPVPSKKTKRKIRCTQEFNQLCRQSLGVTPKDNEKKISEKNKDFSYLPKIDMDFRSKENYSPNISEKELSKRKSNKRKSESSSKDVFQNICHPDSKGSSNKKNNTTFMDEDRKDSTEIQFKKRKRKNRQLYFEEQSKPSSHENVTNIRTEGNNNTIIKTTKRLQSQNNIEQNFGTNEVVYCIKETSPKSSIKNVNECTAGKSMLKIPSKSLSDLSPCYISCEELSDTVFDDNFKLSETLECNNKLTLGNTSNKSNTFELQNSIFDVSQLPVIPSIEKGGLENNRNRRSMSLNIEENISKNFIYNSKSFNCMKNEDCNRSKSISGILNKLNKTSLCNVSYGSRNSVQLTEDKKYKDSPIYKSNNSIKYRKSTNIKKLPKVCSKNQTFSPDIELKLSPNTQKTFAISPDGMSTSFNKTFEIISPTKSESKITKRRKWNRSLGVSLLDSTGLMHIISSPWQNKQLDDSFNFSYGSSSSPMKNLFEFNCQSINSTQKTSNYSTPTKKISSRKKLSVMVNEGKQSKSKATHIKTTIQTDTNKTNYESANKKIRMPNFALIHQKAYDKLENLKEMTERKAARTQLLLSGKNPQKLKIKSPNSKKLLRFDPKRKSLDKLKKPQTTLKPYTKEEVAPSTSNPKVIIDKSSNNKIKSNIPRLTKKTLESQKKKLSTEGKKKLSTEGKKKLSTEGMKKLKEGQIKAIANKTKVVKNTIETRRNAVRNVRSNRRFDLLMNMRKGKN